LDTLLKQLNRREEVQMLHWGMVSALIVASKLDLEIIKRNEIRMIV
jgi:hypothetical protein